MYLTLFFQSFSDCLSIKVGFEPGSLGHGVEGVELFALVLDRRHALEAGLQGAEDHGVDDVHLAPELKAKSTVVLNLLSIVVFNILSTVVINRMSTTVLNLLSCIFKLKLNILGNDNGKKYLSCCPGDNISLLLK